MQDPQFIHKLQKGRERHGITVRVVRKWTIYNTTGQGVPLHVGMVLADAKVSMSLNLSEIYGTSPAVIIEHSQINQLQSSTLI